MFENSRSQKEYCLIGLNKFNYEIGKILLKEGHKVTVLDIDQKKIDTLGEIFNYSIVCDTTNIKELSDIGIQYFDYVILGITDIKVSVITAANLRELNVEKVICKAKDGSHKKILKFLGINIAYIPEEEIATKVAYKAMHDLNVELLSFDDQLKIKNTLVIKIYAKNKNLWSKKVKEINFLKDIEITIISIKREEGKIIIPVSGEDTIEKNDLVCLICNKEKIKQLQDYFDSDKN